MSFNLLRRWSPEYALNEAYADVKEEGMKGLKKHLTANALKTIENVESIGNLGTRTEHKTDSFDYGLHFTENAAPTDGEAAGSIRIVFPEQKILNFTYNADKNGYTGFQWNSDYVDDTTKEPVVFQNVLILATPTQVGADDHWHSVITTTDYEGTGLFFNGGYVMPIKWSRGGLNTPFKFFDEQGNDLQLGIGHSYIGFVSSTYGGATYS